MTKEMNKYQDTLIREYVWGYGETYQIVNGFYNFYDEDEVDIDDYWSIVIDIDNCIGQELLDEICSCKDMNKWIDHYSSLIYKKLLVVSE